MRDGQRFAATGQKKGYQWLENIRLKKWYHDGDWATQTYQENRGEVG